MKELLLEHYRKKMRLSYNSFLRDPKKGNRICCIKTYKNIIDGKIVRDKENIISELFDRIGKKPLVNIELNYSKLSMLMEYGNTNDITIETGNILQYLFEYRYHALLEYNFKAIKLLDNYYKDKIFPNSSEVLELLDIQNLLDSTLVSLVHVVFINQFHMGLLPNDFDISIINNYKKQHLQVKISDFIDYLNIYSEAKALVLAIDIEKLIKEDNVSAKLKFYPHLIHLYNNMGKETIIYETELNRLLWDIELNISDNIKNTTLVNLGIYKILDNEYKIALSYFDLLKDIEDNRLIQIYIYKLFCMVSVNHIIKVEDYILKISNIKKSNTKLLYCYFVEQEHDEKKKCKLLLNIMKKYIDENDYFYIFIIEKEIIRNCKRMNRYKALNDFFELKSSILEKKGV